MSETSKKPERKTTVYGRASTIDGRYATVKAADRPAYDRGAAKLVQASRAGRRS